MGCYDDIYHADCFFIIGSNMAEAHPVIFNILNERKKKNPNVKVIVADPRKTLTARIADLHMSFIPGTDLAILNAMANVIIKENLYDKNFINEHVVFKKIKDDNFKAKINLQPKSLGNLIIEISQNQGNINIQFNVDNQDTGKLIDNTLYNFKERLIQSGILNYNNDVNINIQLNLTNYNQNENQKNNNKQSKVNKRYNVENLINTATEKDSNTKIYNKFNGGKIVEKYI
jgi:anaerobic selenocysteine-containing dehydrogenase